MKTLAKILLALGLAVGMPPCVTAQPVITGTTSTVTKNSTTGALISSLTIGSGITLTNASGGNITTLTGSVTDLRLGTVSLSASTLTLAGVAMLGTAQTFSATQTFSGPFVRTTTASIGTLTLSNALAVAQGGTGGTTATTAATALGVPMLAGANTFIGANTFSGAVTATTISSTATLSLAGAGANVGSLTLGSSSGAAFMASSSSMLTLYSSQGVRLTGSQSIIGSNNQPVIILSDVGGTTISSLIVGNGQNGNPATLTVTSSATNAGLTVAMKGTGVLALPANTTIGGATSGNVTATGTSATYSLPMYSSVTGRALVTSTITSSDGINYNFPGSGSFIGDLSTTGTIFGDSLTLTSTSIDSSGNISAASLTLTTGDINLGSGSLANAFSGTFSGGVATSTLSATTATISSLTVGGTFSKIVAGTVSLSAGTKTVTDSAVTTSSIIIPAVKTRGGTVVLPPNVVVGTGTFSLTATATDTSTYSYLILTP